MMYTEAVQLESSALEENWNWPSGVRDPRTPASSQDSRIAASSADSLFSQPPFGMTQPLPRRLDIKRTSHSDALVDALSSLLRLTGTEPATRRSPAVP